MTVPHVLPASSDSLSHLTDGLFVQDIMISCQASPVADLEFYQKTMLLAEAIKIFSKSVLFLNATFLLGK